MIRRDFNEMLFFFLQMAPKYELCVGLNKGHNTTKIKQKQYRGDRKEKGIRQARKKNVSFLRKLNFV